MVFTLILFLIFEIQNYNVEGACSPNSKSITTVSGKLAPKEEICSGDLIFEDVFDYFDLRVWRHEMTLGGGSSNNQFQIYGNNRSNTYVKDGALHFRPTPTAYDIGEAALSRNTIDLNSWYPHLACTNGQYDGCKRQGNPKIILNPVKSARIQTIEAFAFKYGKVEVRAKTPKGDWIWPAIWLMPRWNQYGGWPVSGEIDIMESRGNTQLIQNGINVGVHRITSTLHWGTSSQTNKYKLFLFNRDNATAWCDNFHNYQLEWTPDHIIFSIDDEETGRVTPPPGGFWEMGNFNATNYNNPWVPGNKMTPFDDEFYIIINVAIGSTSYFSDYATNIPYPKPWKNTDGRAAYKKFWDANANWLPTWNINTDDSHLQIDYVRVWAL